MYCSYCGNKIKDEAAFCPECGLRISKTEEAEKSGTAEEQKSEETKKESVQPEEAVKEEKEEAAEKGKEADQQELLEELHLSMKRIVTLLSAHILIILIIALYYFWNLKEWQCFMGYY